MLLGKAMLLIKRLLWQLIHAPVAHKCSSEQVLSTKAQSNPSKQKAVLCGLKPLSKHEEVRPLVRVPNKKMYCHKLGM